MGWQWLSGGDRQGGVDALKPAPNARRRSSEAEGRAAARIISMRAGFFWILGLFGGACALLFLGSLPGDLGHTLFGNALCGPWG